MLENLKEKKKKKDKTKHNNYVCRYLKKEKKGFDFTQITSIKEPLLLQING